MALRTITVQLQSPYSYNHGTITISVQFRECPGSCCSMYSIRLYQLKHSSLVIAYMEVL
ncbi:hypothetical protein HYPBUDRAFT_151404, partial [Hyphopichia burtonii NRRL Y-1933]